MSKQDFPNEYSNINSEELSKDLESITNNKENSKRKARGGVHTFAEDVAREMKSNNASVIKIALAEQSRQREYQTIVTKSKNQRVLYLALTFIFVMGGALVLGLVVRQNNACVTIPNQNQTKANSLVFSEQQIVVDVTDFSRAEFLNVVRQKIDTIKSEGITNVIITLKENGGARVQTGPELFSLVAQNLPAGFTGLLSPSVMFGIDGVHDFSNFLIFKHKNLDLMISYMRGWEGFLLQDVQIFLDPNTSGISDFSRSFESEVLFNKNARLLRDVNGGLIVGYVFLDPETIAIITNINSLEEILKRYSIQGIQ